MAAGSQVGSCCANSPYERLLEGKEGLIQGAVWSNPRVVKPGVNGLQGHLFMAQVKCVWPVPPRVARGFRSAVCHPSDR